MASRPYYIIFDVEIHDVERYLTYMERVAPALEAAGGRYLARGGALTTYEGAQAPAYPEPAKVRADLARLLERPNVPLDPSFSTVEHGQLIVEKGTFAS